MNPLKTMSTILVSLLTLISLVAISQLNANEVRNQTDPEDSRAYRLRPNFLRPSLFNLIRFNNDECLDSTNQSGTCYTPKECKSYGGQGTALCAQGYGICCIISKSCHNRTSEKVVYFKNPSFPSSDNHENYCDLSVDIVNPNVCQLRLDLIQFELDQPTQGRCLSDKMLITVSRRSGMSPPVLCGSNSHTHMYIPLPRELEDRSLTILMATNNDGPYRWQIRVTQIECVSRVQKSRSLASFLAVASLKQSVPAPIGCLQYYPDRTGTIQSFNLGHYLNDLDYAICIERFPETCKVRFMVSNDGDWSLDRTSGAKDFSGVGDEDCKTDYVIIPGGSQTGDGRTSDRFCGGRLNHNKSAPVNSPVVTKASGPIMVRFHSDDQFEPTSSYGFRMKFEQIGEGCPISYGKEFQNLRGEDLRRPILISLLQAGFNQSGESTIASVITDRRSNNKFMRL